jgi:hypothetical protein
MKLETLLSVARTVPGIRAYSKTRFAPVWMLRNMGQSVCAPLPPHLPGTPFPCFPAALKSAGGCFSKNNGFFKRQAEPHFHYLFWRKRLCIGKRRHRLIVNNVIIIADKICPLTHTTSQPPYKPKSLTARPKFGQTVRQDRLGV